MSPSFASFVCYYFQFYPYWPFVNPPRRPSRPSKLSGKPKSLLTLLLCYFGLQLVNWLYFYPPSHPYRFTGNQPTPKPTGPSPTHLPRGFWERRCPILPGVLQRTYFSLKFQFTFHLLKKVIELASSSTSLLFVAADIIITVSWSSSPSNIIKTTGCHVNHNSSPTRDSASQDIPSFLYKRRQGCKWRFWREKRWSYPYFSLPVWVVLTHAYLAYLIR